MKQLLFSVNITSVILGVVSFLSISEANRSVDFYLFGLQDDARFLFVGEENVVLICETKEILYPTFKLEFQGEMLFDGSSLVNQHRNHYTVYVKESCLQLTVRRLELSMAGEYTCLVTNVSTDKSKILSSSLNLGIQQSPQCRNTGSMNFTMQLDCIHLRGEEVVWSLEAFQNNNTITVDLTIGVFNRLFGTNKILSQLSQSYGPTIKSYKCSLKHDPMSFCIIANNFTALFKATAISPSKNVKVGLTNCSSSFNGLATAIFQNVADETLRTTVLTLEGTQDPSTTFVQNITETSVPISTATDERPVLNSLEKIIVSIVTVVLVSILITIVLCVYFKHRDQRKREERHERINQLFGSKFQINHHASQQDYTGSSESSDSKTSEDNSVSHTIHKNKPFAEYNRRVPEVRTEIPQPNPVYTASPIKEISSYVLQVPVPNTSQPSDPVDEKAPRAPPKTTTSKEKSGNTAIGNETRKLSYRQGHHSDHVCPIPFVNTNVDGKTKTKSYKIKTTNLDKQTDVQNSSPTGDHICHYHDKTGMGDDTVTRL